MNVPSLRTIDTTSRSLSTDGLFRLLSERKLQTNSSSRVLLLSNKATCLDTRRTLTGILVALRSDDTIDQMLFLPCFALAPLPTRSAEHSWIFYRLPGFRGFQPRIQKLPVLLSLHFNENSCTGLENLHETPLRGRIARQGATFALTFLESWEGYHGNAEVTRAAVYLSET